MRPDDPRHGARGRAGYDQHRRDNEEPCQPCRDAAARYERGRQLDILTGRPRLVPAAGARRKIQALVALGHPFAAIARQVGVRSENLRKFAYRDTDIMLARLAHQIDAAYDALSMRLPDTAPGQPARRSAEARTIAREHGWAVPLAWEGLDINDPATAPHNDQALHDESDVDEVAVLRALNGHPPEHLTKAERIEIVTAARALGMSLKQITARTGISKPERYIRPSTALNTKENTAA